MVVGLHWDVPNAILRYSPVPLRSGLLEDMLEIASRANGDGYHNTMPSNLHRALGM
jgi:hypothetical protein